MKKILYLIPLFALLGFGAAAYASTISNTPNLFETYLANSEGSTDTSMVLASATLRDGSTLSGFTCFTVDSNTPTVEYECGTVSGTNVTGLTRGIDAVTGTTTIASLQYAHHRGADVKVTDYPTLTILSRIFQAVDGVALPFHYDSGVSTTSITLNRSNIVDYGLLQDTAISGAGILNAASSAKGVVQLATAVQVAASTATGSTGAALVVPSSIATSTYNSATAGNVVVVTNGSGQIDPGFVSSIMPTGAILSYSSSTAPTGWLEADGSAVSRTTYANLFAVEGTSYGYGDGATTFNVPDLRSSVAMGQGAKVNVATTSALTGVNTGTDLITITSPANDWMQTGEAVAVTGAALPSGITAGTYYVIRVSATTLKLASSLANAQNLSQVDITATGTGTMTMTQTLTGQAIGYEGGEQAHAMTINELLAHSHTYTPNYNGSNAGQVPATGTPGSSPTTAASTNATGGNAAMPILNPYTTVNYIIKT